MMKLNNEYYTMKEFNKILYKIVGILNKKHRFPYYDYKMLKGKYKKDKAIDFHYKTERMINIIKCILDLNSKAVIKREVIKKNDK